MGKLFNVRLSAEDQARVRALREQGVEIAELIRSAIHHAYDHQMQPPRTSVDVRHIIRELNETYPTPAETFPPIDTTHRQEMQEYIRQQLGAQTIPMILLDTNVLVALLNERDSLHGRAVDDLAILAHETFSTITPVLAETCFLLPTLNGRRKLHALLRRLLIVPVASDTDEIWQATFDWMIKYAHHEPDWADATLAVSPGAIPKLVFGVMTASFKPSGDARTVRAFRWQLHDAY